MMAGITLLSGSAGVQTGPIGFAGMDKLGHLVVFGLLAIAWVRCLEGEAMTPRVRFWSAVLLTAGFGLADEWHQYHNPQRTFEWADLAADCLGAVLAAAAYLNLGRLRALLEWKPGRRGA